MPSTPPIRIEDIAHYKFSRVELDDIKDPYDRGKKVAETVSDPEARFRAHPAGADWIWLNHGKWDRDPADTDRFKGDYFKWEEHWRQIDAEILMKVFTFEECMRLRQGTVIMSNFGEWFDEHHPFLRKIIFAHWHYGCDHDWNEFVDHVEAFQKLRIDLPDFEIRLTHTRTINTCAWSAHLRDLYVDASFGLLLYYKGEHVLTIGFAPCRRGVMVAQVQLRQKKGNRFLYKLPKHYLDLALDVLRNAFGDCLWLATGGSTVNGIRKGYAFGQNPCTMTFEDELRIAALYDRPLESFRRNARITYSHQDSGRTFVRLHAKRCRVSSCRTKPIPHASLTS